ncbi:MAG: hypothetical protein QM724_11935 [Flavobacteriales bacterium]
MSTPVTLRSLASMPAHARVWVYKSARAFTPAERAAINEQGAAFVAGWSAHDLPLDAWAGTVGDHFLVIAVDQEQAAASGCGIDKSVRFVQELERGLGLRLTDRMVVLYEAGDQVKAGTVEELPALLERGALTGDTLVYDDLVATKGDLDARFRVPLRATWMARYLRS